MPLVDLILSLLFWVGWHPCDYHHLLNISLWTLVLFFFIHILSPFLFLTSYFSFLSVWDLRNRRDEILQWASPPSLLSPALREIQCDLLLQQGCCFTADDRNFVQTSVEPLGFWQKTYLGGGKHSVQVDSAGCVKKIDPIFITTTSEPVG